ncbi:disease resistance protein RPS5-like isoform X2 [Silene latifolia]
MDTLMEIVPPAYEWFKPYLNMSQRRAELRKLVNDLKVLNTDLDNLLKGEEQRCQTRRRQEVVAYLQTSNVLVNGAARVLDECEEVGVLKQLRCVSSIEQYLSEAEVLVDRGRSWMNNALSYNDVRGEKLPVRDLELMGKTARQNLDSALIAVTTARKYNIGIYGCPGAGKKSLMKHIYNSVLKLDHHSDFKSADVFWAEAPENPRDDYALQEKVSEGMRFDIKHDIDCVRRSSFLEERFQEMAASGRAPILFLCNLREEFRAYEVLGISATNCVLVFTAPSLDVCNRMKCDVIIKVDHLPREEAEELFMLEAGLNDDLHRQEIKDVASQIANECARMPLAIRVIANSMREINDIHEWRNRLTELLGRINSINNEEDKILEQLRFGYTCLEDPITRRCFNLAAQILAKDSQLSKETVIEKWREHKLIGNGCHFDDQGHTMLNQLERLCLLELEPENQLVTMNKWIRNIATVL